MTTAGPLDDYLSADEDAYFKSKGAEAEETKIEESLSDAGDDSSASDLSSDEVGSDNSGRDDVYAENETDADVDSSADEDEPASKGQRDYEKAFKVELAKRKELKEELDLTNRKAFEMEQILAQLKDSMTKPAQSQEPKEVVPDQDEDPLAYQQYKINKLERSLEEHNNYLRQQHDMQQRNTQQQAFMNTYRASAQEFSAKTPEFSEAYKFLLGARMAEHKAAGYSDQEAQSLLVEEEMSIVAKAYHDKVNPAERIYNVAKNRGYSAANAKKTPVAPRSLSDIKRGMANSKSLKSGGGELPSSTPGVDAIDGMDFAQFDEFWAGYKNKAKGQR